MQDVAAAFDELNVARWLWEFGHFRNPAYPEAHNVNVEDLGSLEVDDVVGPLDEAQPGQLPDLAPVEAGLEVEVELLQRLDPGKTSLP